MMFEDLQSEKIKKAFLLTLGIQIIMLIASGVLYKERMLYCDPQWMNFLIQQDKWFKIQEYRYGSFITHLFPVVMGRLGCSFTAILVMYSMSFHLFYTFVTWLVGWKWKQYGLAILGGVYLLGFVSEEWYWPNNEVHQGIFWMLLVLGYYAKNIQQTWKAPQYIIIALLLFLAVFSHFLVILPLGFILALEWILNKSNLDYKKWGVTTGLFLLIFLIKYLIGKNSWYDGSKLNGVTNVSFETLLNVFNTAQIKDFSALLIKDFWPTLLVGVISLGLLIYHKKWLGLGLFIATTLVYFILLGITYPEAITPTNRFYFESEWMGLSVIWVLPLLVLKPRTSHFEVGLIYVSGIAGVLFAYNKFHTRYLKLDKMITNAQSMNLSKVLVYSDQETIEAHFMMPWGIPTETMSLSVLRDIYPNVTIKISSEPLPDITTHQFYNCFDTASVNILGNPYFQVDTTHNYTIVPLEQLLKD